MNSQNIQTQKNGEQCPPFLELFSFGNWYGCNAAGIWNWYIITVWFTKVVKSWIFLIVSNLRFYGRNTCFFQWFNILFCAFQIRIINNNRTAFSTVINQILADIPLFLIWQNRCIFIATPVKLTPIDLIGCTCAMRCICIVTPRIAVAATRHGHHKSKHTNNSNKKLYFWIALMF